MTNNDFLIDTIDLITILLASISVAFVYYRTFKLNQKQRLDYFLDIEKGKCIYCNEINKKDVIKSRFWTKLICSKCNKISKIHVNTK
jgi:hypothetical protein